MWLSFLEKIGEMFASFKCQTSVTEMYKWSDRNKENDQLKIIIDRHEILSITKKSAFA